MAGTAAHEKGREDRRGRWEQKGDWGAEDDRSTALEAGCNEKDGEAQTFLLFYGLAANHCIFFSFTFQTKSSITSLCVMSTVLERLLTQSSIPSVTSAPTVLVANNTARSTELSNSVMERNYNIFHFQTKQ